MEGVPRKRRGERAQSFYAMLFGQVVLPAFEYIHQPTWKVLNPILLGFYEGFII